MMDDSEKRIKIQRLRELMNDRWKEYSLRFNKANKYQRLDYNNNCYKFSIDCERFCLNCRKINKTIISLYFFFARESCIVSRKKQKLPFINYVHFSKLFPKFVKQAEKERMANLVNFEHRVTSMCTKLRFFFMNVSSEKRCTVIFKLSYLFVV